MIDFTTTTATAPTSSTLGWRVTVPPAYFPVTFEEVCAQLRLPSDASSPQINLMIAAATDYAEDVMTIALAPRTIEVTFAAGMTTLDLPRGPFIEFVSVKNADGSAVTGFSVELIGFTHRLRLPTAGITYPLTVTYRAGYLSPILTNDLSEAAAIPPAIRMAILMHVGTLYEARESTTDKARTAVPHSLEAFYQRKARGKGVG